MDPDAHAKGSIGATTSAESAGSAQNEAILKRNRTKAPFDELTGDTASRYRS
jgi:hypothetical protein